MCVAISGLNSRVCPRSAREDDNTTLKLELLSPGLWHATKQNAEKQYIQRKIGREGLKSLLVCPNNCLSNDYQLIIWYQVIDLLHAGRDNSSQDL